MKIKEKDQEKSIKELLLQDIYKSYIKAPKLLSTASPPYLLLTPVINPINNFLCVRQN